MPKLFGRTRFRGETSKTTSAVFLDSRYDENLDRFQIAQFALFSSTFFFFFFVLSKRFSSSRPFDRTCANKSRGLFNAMHSTTEMAQLLGSPEERS